MTTTDPELLVVKRSALVQLPGRPEVRLAKGAVIRADDPIVKGREDHFEPVHRDDVQARTSFVTGTTLVVRGTRFSKGSPIVKGREQMFVPVTAKMIETPPRRARPQSASKRPPAKPATRRTK